MEYKVTKKADGWYVGGERFSSQGAATTRLLALLSGGKSATKARPTARPTARPSAAGGAKPAKKAAASRFHLIESGVPELVNGEHLDGYEAKVIGPVSYPPEGLNPDVTYVVLVAKIARSGKEVYDVVAFDDESLYDHKIQKNIPDLKTAEMLAEGAWHTMNGHAMRYTPEFLAAADKYKA